MVDNNAWLKRQQHRRNLGMTGLSGFGDYPAFLPNRVMETSGGVDQKGAITAPTIAAPGSFDSVTALLMQIRDLLSRMPVLLSQEFELRYVLQSRASFSFVNPSGPVNVAAGAAAVIVSQSVQERFNGFLTHVGIGVDPPGSFPNITWQIRVNGAIHPDFSNRIFAASTLATPLPFVLELTPTRTVQLVAINTAGAPISVSGILLGWTKLLTSEDQYGQPSGVIA